MNYLSSFIFCGFICMISQYFLEKTKLTPGHVNTLLVIIGALLSGFHIYDKLLEIFNCGASVPIMNFGHLLAKGASEGYNNNGIIGLFNGIYKYAGHGISVAIFIAFSTSLFFKIKN